MASAAFSAASQDVPAMQLATSDTPAYSDADVFLQVPEAHITDVYTQSHVASGDVTLHISGSPAAAALPFTAVISMDGTPITAFQGRVDSPLRVAINDGKLWSPESPFLYDIEISLLKDQQLQDSADLSASATAASEQQIVIDASRGFVDAEGQAQLQAASGSSADGASVPAAVRRQLPVSRRRQLLAASAYRGPIWHKMAAQACALVPKACQLVASMQQKAAAAAKQVTTTAQSQAPHQHQVLLPASKSTNTEVVDRVQSYFGVREISVGPVGPGGHPRPLLNGEFVFQIGMLDQVSATFHRLFLHGCIGQQSWGDAACIRQLHCGGNTLKQQLAEILYQAISAAWHFASATKASLSCTCWFCFSQSHDHPRG